MNLMGTTTTFYRLEFIFICFQQKGQVFSVDIHIVLVLIQIDNRVLATEGAFHTYASIAVSTIIEGEYVLGGLFKHSFHTPFTHPMLTNVFGESTWFGHQAQTDWAIFDEVRRLLLGVIGKNFLFHFFLLWWFGRLSIINRLTIYFSWRSFLERASVHLISQVLLLVRVEFGLYLQSFHMVTNFDS